MSGRTVQPVRAISHFLVNHACSTSFIRQLHSHSRSLSNIRRHRSLVHSAAIHGLRPLVHLSACPRHPTQSGAWIKNLPLRACSVVGGRLRVVHRNQAARTRPASKYFTLFGLYVRYFAGRAQTCSPVSFTCRIRWSVFYFSGALLLSPSNHPFADFRVTINFAEYVLTCAIFFPVNVPDDTSSVNTRWSPGGECESAGRWFLEYLPQPLRSIQMGPESTWSRPTGNVLLIRAPRHHVEKSHSLRLVRATSYTFMVI